MAALRACHATLQLHNSVLRRNISGTCHKPLQWLPHCKLADLKHIANAIGSNTGGTKAVLSSSLQGDLQKDRFVLPKSPGGKLIRDAHHDIVSIDMGIRNLAFCRLSLSPHWTSVTQPAVPVIHDWARIAISKRPSAEGSVDDAPRSIIKETFDPATYSQHAYFLLEKLLSNSPPTQILIERQRFRSMGGSAVQEWTLRVNMFEAMLYAVLRTLSERGIWNGAVHPVAPAKVFKFWLGDAEVGLGKRATSSSSRTKAAKVEMVAKWLQEQDQFVLERRAAKIGQAYLKKTQGAKRVVVEQDGLSKKMASGPPEVEIGKLDDLADCLLQGMAWIQWEKHRRTILAGGIEALQHL